MATVTKIRQLTAQRKSNIQRISEIRRIAENALQDRDIHTNFKMRYKRLDLIIEDFEKQHSNLIALLATDESADFDLENDIRANFENDYYQIQTIYSQLFENDLNKKPVEQSVSSVNVKLPEIEVHTFSGDLNTWQTFIDSFDSLVHNNDALTNIDKFNYLIASVSGTPLNVVKRTPLTGENYINAYNSLRKRFENKKIISSTYWHAIENTKKITNAHNYSQSLRNLVDTFTENVAALKNLGYAVEGWDFPLFFMLLDRLDTDTATKFEMSLASDQVPPFQTLVDFVTKQCNAFDTVAHSSQMSNKKIDYKPKFNPVLSQVNIPKYKQSSSFFAKANNIGNKMSCALCKLDHLIYSCPSFLAQSPQERYAIVKTNKWCSNCLGSKHTLAKCPSQHTCKKCVRKHHTLLHFDDHLSKTNCNSLNQNNNENLIATNNIDNAEPCTSTQVNTAIVPSKTTVLLSTAQIEILDSRGNFQNMRVLLDSGSQANFITEKCCKKLGLKRSHLSLVINSMGHMSSTATQGVHCTIRPQGHTKPLFNLDCAILPKICSNMPTFDLPKPEFDYLKNIKLADSKFAVSAPIDMLLGADIFSLIIKGGRLKGSVEEPTALDTIFGWIIMGRVNCTLSSPINVLFSTIELSLENTIKQFWEIENIPQINAISPDESLAENIFLNTFDRNSSGRYIVTLPFKGPQPAFEGSRDISLRQFYSLERRLIKDPTLYKKYRDFMQDYLDCGHMERIHNNSLHHNSYYIPHHCILKPSSSTTKLRVVFNASMKTSQNISLNDTLLVGPKLQSNIVSILLNFRLHSVVFTADIKQMYRQIVVANSHTDYQRILWRFSDKEPIQDYRLLTVTYGVSSAPFLAIRTLIQLAKDEQPRYPLASNILSSDTYVDDIVSGCASIEEAVTAQTQLIQLLKSGGFELRKWASNHPALLSHLPESSLQIKPLSFDLEKDNTIKILGLQWHPSQDIFSYQVEPIDRPCTKRTILSELARIFDPLGFLAPLTFFAKLMIQVLWSLGLEWDETPPDEILHRWSQYKNELSLLSNLQIPRQLVINNYLSCEMHGFCDSSEKGYAAVIYFRVFFNTKKINTFFVCAKSKVAPLKRISIPRLELCAAVLLADLLAFVQNTYTNKINFHSLKAWTDSTVVLSWIKSSPHKWKTFVSNRVSRIQDKISPIHWFHVKTQDNPADCASRGLLPSELLHHPLWWAGPPWLSMPDDAWPVSTFNNFDISADISETRKIVLTTLTDFDTLDTILEKFSELSKSVRVIAYALRFINNSRKPRNDRKYCPITINELNNALLIFIKHAQFTAFREEISKLDNRTSPKWLRKLNAFLDDMGILRVGGRLINSDLSYNKKHPILLPSRHRLTTLIIKSTHKQYLHPGLQTLQFLLAQRYWILSPKRTIRRILSSCYKCWRTNPTSHQPPMGNLPSVRISQVKPFSNVGVDYGGPFTITMSRIRGAKTQKAYICLFVCLATKALHLELASDLSAEAFLAALRRFISRRGRCTNIYSDCGTNFVGAWKQLSQMMEVAASQETITWHFIPPSAPNFGGIWEAGIKSVKTHLTRVIGQQILTYEELLTVLTQIEAVLNSRPLYALSSDPNDLSALTPGHFLTLEPLNTLLDPNLQNLKLSRLSRWQLLQRLHQDFWSRWRREYLHTLLQRSKWYDSSTPIVPNTMVVVKDNLSPPLNWHLGRVEEIHPGRDGVTRVVTVRTAKGIFKRPVTKICPLPLHDS